MKVGCRVGCKLHVRIPSGHVCIPQSHVQFILCGLAFFQMENLRVIYGFGSFLKINKSEKGD